MDYVKALNQAMHCVRTSNLSMVDKINVLRVLKDLRETEETRDKVLNS